MERPASRHGGSIGSTAAKRRVVWCLTTTITFGGWQSGRAQPHSKTFRDVRHAPARAGVLECGCPLGLWLARVTSAYAVMRRAKCFVLPLMLAGLAAGGCTTVSLPPANLKAPGWTVHTGQAVWRRKPGGEGIAGELLVATRSDGRAFVQFSKGPFPLVVAQSTPEVWTAEFPPQNAHYSGHGLPPQRIIFLYLPRVLAGLPLPRRWSWQPLRTGGWQLLNAESGESLDVYFRP
jgi:hypothetical protein